MQETFISIIIPTKERSYTLAHSIKSVLVQKYSNFELIISDNFSSDETKKVVESFNDSRIVYLNTGQRVSMSQNWEFALNHFQGDWVTIIGDDDALLPDALQKVDKLVSKYHEIEAIRSDTCYYFYPKVNNQEFGIFGIPLNFGSNYEIRNSEKWLKKVLFGKYNYTELPMLYNGGFISKKLIEKAKIFNNQFINSCIPDVYSSMIFSHLTKHYLYSFEPFAINGASLKSNGISQFSDDSKKKSSISNQFQIENNIEFNEKIPLYSDGRFPQSIKAFIYESYFNCIELLKIPSLINSNKQIETILIYDFKKDEFFNEWIRRYSKKEKVNYIKVKSLSKIKILFARLNNIKKFGKYIEIGDKIFPIINVFDATLYYIPITAVVYSTYKSIIKIQIRKLFHF
jgi:glycosyltransferase involved in cell wall biosynthesis